MAENPQILGDRGKSLEDEFFRKENERAIARLRELKDRTTSRESLAKAIGITNEKIIDRLIELGIRPGWASISRSHPRQSPGLAGARRRRALI